jgi:hypothetical protein
MIKDFLIEFYFIFQLSMKTKILLSFICLLFLSQLISAQDFSAQKYLEVRQQNLGLTEAELVNLYSRPLDFYIKGFEKVPDLHEIQYLDSVQLKLKLTNDELKLLEQNLFFVTERLSYFNFGHAFHMIYELDLPVFITTDAVLHALHMSYDQILKTMEREIMLANLEEFLKSLYDGFGIIEQKYNGQVALAEGLVDADLYVTIAYSLLTGNLHPGHIADPEELKKVWEAIKSEKMVSMPLFTFPDRNRNLDFSQFKVRGHYVYTQEDEWMGLKSLEPYFRTMMWLGRTDFLLTPPPENPWEKPWTDAEIQRMNYGAFMVNELMNSSASLEKFRFNEQVINYLVGESDNLTTAEYSHLMQAEGINSALQLADSATFQKVKSALNGNSEFGQKILSDFFLMDPAAEEPGVLPVSYRVSGQRFIIDSYILGSVVYDRLMFNGQKVMRMMPNPLDALFVLGNNDALPLLQDEFNKYPYAEQMANLRFLVDQKPPEFWSESLYNVWLNSIRKLNPAEENPAFPLFMRTAAWHQEKINTQLASWSHLRHDNLLYAKQSYTGGTGCSFPFSYIEPYPEFYRSLKKYASEASAFFSQLPSENYLLNQIVQFFPRFEYVMEQLEILSEKQLSGALFSEDETAWLKSMLFIDGGSGMPPYSGWYADLFFVQEDAAKNDFTIVDIHTQPTDEYGNVVGKVLHTGVGNVNLGVFIAGNPLNRNEQMAFVGPVLSYYEKTTENFLRMTDQDWKDIVDKNDVPERPSWTNIYLAGVSGEAREPGLELPSRLLTGTTRISGPELSISAWPNPVADVLTISFSAIRPATCRVSIYNSNGVLIKQSVGDFIANGENSIQISFHGLPDGLYLAKVLLDNSETSVLKIIKKH